MKKEIPLKWLVTILFSSFLSGLLISQPCTNNVRGCTENLGYVIADFAKIDPLSLCGDRVLVSVAFKPTTTEQLTFDCDINVCLNPSFTNNIVFAGMPDNSPYGASGIGNTFVSFDHPLTDELPPLEFYIRTNCEAWSDVGTNDLSNNWINLTTCVTKDLELACIKTSSDPIEIQYSEIRLGDNNSINGIRLNDPFDISIPLEIYGTNCDPTDQSAVGISVSFDQEIDLSNAIVCIDFENEDYEGASFTPENVNNVLSVSIHPNNFTNVDAFCSDVFRQGAGEATLSVKGLILDGCPEPVMTATYTIDNCPNPDADCIPIGCSSEASSFLNMENGQPRLDMTWHVKNNPGSQLYPIDLCNSAGRPTHVVFTISNNTPDIATDIAVDFDFPDFIQVRRFRMEGMLPRANLQNQNNVFNGLHSSVPGSCPIIEGFSRNGMNFDFSCKDNNANGNLGLSDADGNLFFSDLEPFESFFILVELQARCPEINPDACGLPFEEQIPTIDGRVRWNNECHTLSKDQRMESNLIDPGDPFLISGPPPEFNFNCGDSPDVDKDGRINVNFCYPAWTFSGLSGPLFDHTPSNMEQELILVFGANTDYEVERIRLNGVPLTGINSMLGSRYILDISDAFPPTEERCFDVDLILNCTDGPETINFRTLLTGFWDECDVYQNNESCVIDFGQAEIELYKFCSCFPGGEAWQCGCQQVQTTGFSALRVTPNDVNSCGAYACDEVEMVVRGSILAGEEPYHIGVLSGGFTYERINEVDIFDLNSISVQFEIDGVVYPSFIAGPDPSEDMGSGYDNNNTYRLNYAIGLNNRLITEDLDVVLTITARVNEEAIEEMGTLVPLQYSYPIRDFRGYLATSIDGGQSNAKCTQPGTAQLFNLYRVISGTRSTNVIADCNNVSAAMPGISLGYCGGSNGDEFPLEIRPINQFYGDMTISLEDEFGFLIPDLAIETVVIDDNGNIFTIDIPIPQNQITLNDIQNLIPDPIDKNAFSNLRNLSITFNGNADCDIENVFVHFEGTYETNTYSDLESCKDYVPIDMIAEVEIRNGTVNTYAMNPKIVTACTNSLDLNAPPLSIWVEAPGLDANFAAIYFDLTGIENHIILTPVDGGLVSDSGIEGNYQWFIFTNPIPINGMEVQFNYDILDCDPINFKLPFQLYKQCLQPIVYPELPFNSPDQCLSRGFFDIEVLPSNMTMNVQKCNEPINYCTPVKYSVLINNPSRGPIEDLEFYFLADQNLTLVSARYRYDNAFPIANVFNCNGAGYSDIGLDLEELANGWSPSGILNQTNPSGGLPGFKMMEGDGFRQLHIMIEVEATCENPIETDLVDIRAIADNNCGDPIESAFAGELGLPDENACLELEAEIACHSAILDGDAWDLTFEITGNPGNCPLEIALSSPGYIVTPSSTLNVTGSMMTIEDVSLVHPIDGNRTCSPIFTVDLVSGICGGECPRVIHTTQIGLSISEVNCGVDDMNQICIETLITNNGCFDHGDNDILLVYLLDEDCDGSYETNLGIPSQTVSMPGPFESEPHSICHPSLDVDGCILVVPYFGVRCEVPFESIQCDPLPCQTPGDLVCHEEDGEVSLSWGEVPGAIEYRLTIHYNQFNPTNGPDCGCSDPTAPAYSYTVEGQATEVDLGFHHGCFRWRVEALCENGVYSEPTEWGCYNEEVGCTTPPAVCPTPENLECLVDGVLVLRWLEIPDVLLYEVSINYDDPDCECIEGGTSFVETTTDNFLFWDVNDCFSWSVVAICENGETSLPSETLCYMDGGCAEVICETPRDLRCEEVNGSTELNWLGTTDAAYYRIEFNFGDQNCACNSGSGESWAIAHLNPSLNLSTAMLTPPVENLEEKCFSWRVVTVCGDGDPPTSEWVCYSPENGCDDPPDVCPTPQDLICVFDGEVTSLTWEEIPGAEYMVNILFNFCNCENGGIGFGPMGPFDTNSLELEGTFLTSCFDWTVTAICENGLTSETSEIACYNPEEICQDPVQPIMDSEKRMTNLNSFKVFPNPSQGNLIINYRMEKAGPLTIKVMNIDGKVVKEITNENSISKNFQYNWSIEPGLTNGIYFIYLESEDELMQRKFVLSR